uniref:carbamoyl-phosphate synthase (glutamine-hydrolyzing) n=1 Tax=Ananas comosus var. bracteatus TaxID=296719 RepID=A0A6V7NRM8_ANACO|nr:unnamed protein product [Ananas comosus var. bracteatus]
MATIRSVSYTNPLELPTSNCGFSSKPQIFPQNPSFLPFPKSSPVPLRSARSHRFKSLGISCNQSVKGGSSALGVREEAQRPWKTSDARLVLEDGSIWRAKSFGVCQEHKSVKSCSIQVLYITNCCRYQEILTDPSYAGQFVLMTNPHIGNTGVNTDDEESSRCFLAGLIIRNLILQTGAVRKHLVITWQRETSWAFMMWIHGITRRLRQDGSLIGVLSTEESKTDEDLLEMARRWKIVGVDLISGVSCDAPYEWTDKTDPEWEFQKNQILLMILESNKYLEALASYGCKITVVPSNWPASETLKMKPDGVLFSNGPGDPSAVPYAVETVKAIIGNVPVFGICMGHQLIGQALGGKTFKMKFGHHGGNTQFVISGVDNHNYAVDPESLPAGVEYHPESSPGPHDSDPAFGEFIQLMKAVKANKS